MFTYEIDEEIYLKLLELRDADALFKEVERSRDRLREWLPWLDTNQTVEDSIEFIQYVAEQYVKSNGFQAGIWYKNQLVGVIGFHHINWSNKHTSIGYWLGQDYQGKGIMTRACQALVDYAFHELGLQRVEIRCATGNWKSRAIPERLGFTNEGCVRQVEWLYDHYVDHIIYGMLKDEWK